MKKKQETNVSKKGDKRLYENSDCCPIIDREEQAHLNKVGSNEMQREEVPTHFIKTSFKHGGKIHWAETDGESVLLFWYLPNHPFGMFRECTKEAAENLVHYFIQLSEYEVRVAVEHIAGVRPRSEITQDFMDKVDTVLYGRPHRGE